MWDCKVTMAIWTYNLSTYLLIGGIAFLLAAWFERKRTASLRARVEGLEAAARLAAGLKEHREGMAESNRLEKEQLWRRLDTCERIARGAEVTDQDLVGDLGCSATLAVLDLQRSYRSVWRARHQQDQKTN
jgi:hypothetical protein